jgi:hypothetical protein
MQWKPKQGEFSGDLSPSVTSRDSVWMRLRRRGTLTHQLCATSANRLPIKMPPKQIQAKQIRELQEKLAQHERLLAEKESLIREYWLFRLN